MASNLVTNRAHRRLLDVARGYRRRGYHVLVDPEPAKLPEFLKPFRLDMVAHNADENVVVEVRTQESLSQQPELDVVARALDGRPGWRFELVVTNPKDPTQLRLKDAHLLDRNSVAARLDEARQLSLDEYGEAALLLAWSATEAILRQMATDAGLAVDRSNSEHLVKSLFVYGLLDRSHYEVLQTGLRARNVAAHGFEGEQVNGAVVEQVIAVAEELMG
jgi:hypothetical protein